VELLQNGHANVQLSRRELDRIACWIDLGVPYCGDYAEANIWTAREKAEYAYYQAKRERMRQIEQAHLRAYLDRDDLAAEEEIELPVFDAGGPDAKASFIKAWLESAR
jgi:hypothetical protein